MTYLLLFLTLTLLSKPSFQKTPLLLFMLYYTGDYYYTESRDFNKYLILSTMVIVMVFYTFINIRNFKITLYTILEVLVVTSPKILELIFLYQPTLYLSNFDNVYLKADSWLLWGILSLYYIEELGYHPLKPNVNNIRKYILLVLTSMVIIISI